MEGELVAEIDTQLTYGDSRSEWIRDACRQKLEDGSDADETADVEAADC